MFGLLPLVIIGIIVYALVNGSRNKEQRPESDIGGGISTRRLFQYTLLLGGLVVAATGVTGLLSQVISDTDARRGAELAGPLASTVIGVPFLWLLARWIQKQHQGDPSERHSFAWGFYINAALIGSLFTSGSLAFAIAGGFIDGDGYDGTVVAPFLVATTIWVVHWLVWQRVKPSALTDLHVMAGSAFGLGSIAGGAGFILGSVVDRAFTRAGGLTADRILGDPIWMAVSAIVIGAAIWSWHWLLHGLNSKRTTIWRGYVMLFGILGGLLASVIGGATVLFRVLQWLFGDPGTSSAALHFSDTSWAFGVAAAGAAVWLYHRSVLGFDREEARSDVDRIYDYLVSGIALATVAGALTTLVVAVFSVFETADAVTTGDSDVEIVLLAITLLIVGVPIWLVAWRRAQQAHTEAPEVEAAAPARRTYLFAVFGVGGAIAFGALIRFAFVIFEAVLGERSGGSLVTDMRVPVGLLVTTGAIAAYHWTIYRAEQSQETTKPRRDVVLIWAGGDDQAIERLTNSKIRTLHRLDTTNFDPDVESIAAAIDESDADSLIVIVGDEGLEIIPVA